MSESDAPGNSTTVPAVAVSAPPPAAAVPPPTPPVVASPRAVTPIPRRRLPFLASLAQEVDKLAFAIEEDARRLVQRDIAGVHLHKDAVFAEVREVVADQRAAVTDMRNQLIDVMGAISGANSGDRPPPGNGAPPEEGSEDSSKG